MTNKTEREIKTVFGYINDYPDLQYGNSSHSHMRNADFDSLKQNVLEAFFAHSFKEITTEQYHNVLRKLTKEYRALRDFLVKDMLARERNTD